VIYTLRWVDWVDFKYFFCHPDETGATEISFYFLTNSKKEE